MDLSETSRPDSGERSNGGYTYYCSGQRNGVRLKGMAIATSERIQTFVVGVTPIEAHFGLQILAKLGRCIKSKKLSK